MVGTLSTTCTCTLWQLTKSSVAIAESNTTVQRAAHGSRSEFVSDNKQLRQKSLNGQQGKMATAP